MEYDAVLLDSARTVCAGCLGLQPGETFLVVTDTELATLAAHFVEAGRALGVESLLLEMKPRAVHGEEPPAVIAAALKGADAALLITSCSMTHTSARSGATEAGVRMASMPTLNEDIVRGPLLADYEEIGRLSEFVSGRLTEASRAVLTTPAGTSLTFDLRGRPGIADTGALTEKGAFGNLPAGEAFAPPVEGATEGVLVVDGVMAGVAPLDEPIVMKVEAGRVVDIKGGAAAKELAGLLAQMDENAWCIAEFGIGTNASASLMNNPLVDEKVLGTAHVALGDNAHMGGAQSSKIHIDGIVKDPTIVLDGVVLMEAGKIVG